jgi:hypothetical protein
MVEYLAIPAWNTPPTPLDAWVARLSEVAGPVVVSRESSTVAWLEVASLRLRGYVLIENGDASAINFELHDSDPETAFEALESAASTLGWEIHADEDDDEDEED